MAKLKILSRQIVGSLFRLYNITKTLHYGGSDNSTEDMVENARKKIEELGCQGKALVQGSDCIIVVTSPVMLRAHTLV